MDMNVRQRAEALMREARGAIEALIAELATRNVLVRQPDTTLRLRPDGADVLRQGEDGGVAVLSADGRPQEAVVQLLATADAGLGRDCALDISTGLVLSSRMMLPAESEDIIRAIVRNKVESIAPWPLAQSLYGQRVEAATGDDAHVAVDVGVVSRVLLDDVAALLAASGTVVTAASLRLPSGESLRIDFGSDEESRAAQRRVLRLAGGFAAIAAGVAAVGLVLVWMSSSRLAAAREETDMLTTALRSGTSGGGATLVEAANILHERRRQRSPAVGVMNELSAVLPQAVWLDSLSLDGERIELRGKGSGIPALIDLLEQSPSFTDVNFASATQFNAELNAEAFSIGATLEPAAEGTVP